MAWGLRHSFHFQFTQIFLLKDMLKEGLQVSGCCDNIGDWTLTKTSLIKNGIKLEGWLY